MVQITTRQRNIYLGLLVSGHSEESQEDTPMKTFLHVIHLWMAIQQRIKLARGIAQVGIQTLLKRLIKYYLAQRETRKWKEGNFTHS